MEEQLTKERLDAFEEEKDTLETLLRNRGREILEIASDWGVNLNVCDCDKIQYYDNCFYIVEEWSCRGESGYEHSEEIPLDALFSNEALKKFFEAKKQKERDMKQRKELEEERERKEYERLKAKYESCN